MSMSAEICVIRDLLQNCQQLFDVDDDELERERRQLAEQSKLQNTVSIEEVISRRVNVVYLTGLKVDRINGGRHAELTLTSVKFCWWSVDFLH